MKLLLVSLVVLLSVLPSNARIPGIIPGCTGCSVKGVCYFPNQEWKQGCWTKKCIVYNHGILQGWRTEIVRTQCPDTYNRCVNHGQTMFSDPLCHCNITGYRWSLVCSKK